MLTIAITTFKHRFDKWFKPLVIKLKEIAPDIEIIAVVNGEHNEPFDNHYRKELLKFDIEAMSIPRQNPWDGKWRMVFFDIPTSHKARNIFREKLISMGFFQMQKSVYVNPFPCAKQIKFLREVYEIPDSVKLAVIEHLENDEDLRKFFRLN